jgi:TrmH family RNA methyltransferase
VVEGPILIAEALAAGWLVDVEFVMPGVAPICVGSDTEVFSLASGVLERVTDTEQPQGQIAIVKHPESSPVSLEDAGLVLVADRITDPGNLGTMLRSAVAAGADAVVTTEGTTDPFGPKAVRASAGAVFRMNIVEADLAAVATAGLRILATSSQRGTDHRTVDYSGRVAVVIGNEANGIDVEALGGLEPEWVRIVHHGTAESLNAAMAATLLIFEARRSRDDH